MPRLSPGDFADVRLLLGRLRLRVGWWFPVSPDLNPNLPVSANEVAAVEFVVRCSLASPFRAWFKGKPLADQLPLSASQVGAALGAMVDAGIDGFELDRRPGGRGGSTVGFTRVRDDVHERRWWVEAAARTPSAPWRPSRPEEPGRDVGPRDWWIERGAVNQEAVPA